MHAISMSIGEVFTDEAKLTNDYVSMRRFPYPPYVDDGFISKFLLSRNYFDLCSDLNCLSCIFFHVAVVIFSNLKLFLYIKNLNCIRTI